MGARLPALARPRVDPMIANALFLVIGAGGLGCPALLGLLAGGARRFVLVDDDDVDLSNLPRQVLYTSGDLGIDKIAAAHHALRARCPGEDSFELTPVRSRLAPDPAELDTLLATHAPALVLECSDSPRLKFAVHDACMRGGIPVVIGGVVRWTGQAMAVDPRRHDRACYRCVFEGPPPPELSPACASVGVFGPVTGAIGHTMATLALALLESTLAESGALEHPESPSGTFTHFDLLRGSVRRLAPKPRPDCISCGRNFEASAT